MTGREPNRMVPTALLRDLRDAQRFQVDGPEVVAAVRAIDVAVGFRQLQGWRICGRCGSTRVRWQAVPDMAPKVERWRCFDCGWTASRKVAPG